MRLLGGKNVYSIDGWLLDSISVRGRCRLREVEGRELTRNIIAMDEEHLRKGGGGGCSLLGGYSFKNWEGVVIQYVWGPPKTFNKGIPQCSLSRTGTPPNQKTSKKKKKKTPTKTTKNNHPNQTRISEIGEEN